MSWIPNYQKSIAQLADGLTTMLSFILAYLFWNQFRIYFGIGQPIQLKRDLLWKIIALTIIWIIILSKQKAYTYLRFTSISREFSIIIKTTIIGVFIFFGLYFLFRFHYIPRAYIVIFAVLNSVCLALEKLVLFKTATVFREKGRNRKKVLVVGTGNKAIKFANTTLKNRCWGLDVMGFLTGKSKEVGKTLVHKKILGSFFEIDRVLGENIVDEVLICVPDKDYPVIRDVLETCEREGVQVRLNSDFFGYLAKRVSFDYMYDMPIVSFYTTPNGEWTIFLKRVLDILISAFLLVILAPFYLLIAVLIKLTSPGPVFFEWHVVGQNKKPFKSWKFRTMVHGADALKEKLRKKNEMRGPAFKMENDPRITKMGRFLRKFSLDELPQLWSVLKGDMSLVGPRPPLHSEVKNYSSWHRRKLSMKPGMTCLWQVNGRNDINDFDDWAVLDMEYIDNWSIWLDLKILFMTALAVVRGTGK
jgi:exopolysaccharide biosynthesis polyprenyl glycosylphosphotransferase